MTGRGEGYCVVEIPESAQAPIGYAGLQGDPLRPGARFARWPRPATWPGHALRVGRGRRAGRGRGRRFGWW
jgi:hypothetical protein